MNPINSYFYGDTTRWFMGVVEEVGTDDPQLGRVKVRIFGVHGYRSDVPNADLPYAQVLVPCTEPGVSGLGRNPNLQAGARVFGIFLDGKNSQLPLVLGSIPTIEAPSNEQIASKDAGLNARSPSEVQGSNPYTGTSGSSGVGPGIQSTIKDGLDGFVINPNATLGDRTRVAWEYFTSPKRGYTAEVTAGIIGNLITESNLEPGALGDVNLGGSHGIAQWYSGTPRYNNLIQFASERGKASSDFVAQLAFIHHELSTDPYFKGAELRRQKTPTYAAIHFQRNYERPSYVNAEGGLVKSASSAAPSPVDGKPMRLHENKRIQNAKKVYGNFIRVA